MTPFDYFVMAVMAVSLLLGVARGVVSEILALVAWVVAFFVARLWARPVGDHLFAELAEPLWRALAGFVVVFIAVLIGFALLRWLMRLLLKATGLRPLDRVLGAVFGFLRGAALLLVLVMLAGLTSLPQRPWWRQAQFAPPLETAVLAARPWLPAELAQRIHYR